MQLLQVFELRQQFARGGGVMAAVGQFRDDFTLMRNVLLPQKDMPFGLFQMCCNHGAIHGAV